MREAIRRANGYGKDAYTYYPVVIIGAGESGIAMGCRLKEVLGFDQFRIFERQGGIGGTWWINRYPGVSCDVPAIFYSFSFSPNLQWSKFFPSGEEIVQYLHRVCEKYAITDKVQVNTDVMGCRWLEDEQLWEVELRYMAQGLGDLGVKDRDRIIGEKGESSVYVGHEFVRAKIVLSAVGGLVEPRGWPDNIPGKERFQGSIFHSARWDHNFDIRDKDVVVVGTGCSAAQFVPQLTTTHGAKSVTQLMRSPPWVVPRPTPPFGDAWWNKWSPFLFSTVPVTNKFFRTLIAAGAEYDMRLFHMGEWSAKERSKVEGESLKHLKKVVPEKYHEILTPDYGIGCKRRIYDASWLPLLQDPKVELTTQPLTSVQERSVTIGPGRAYPKLDVADSKAPTAQREVPADAIILANGFDVTRWLHPLKVVGKGGKDLVELMEERGGPQAYQGTAMDGFPNFFIIFGPNTATGHTSVIMATENMVNYALKFVKPILDGDATTVEVKKEAEVAFTQDLQKSLKNRVWNDGCNSWYVDKTTGWNSTVYPYTQIWFMLRCMFPAWWDWKIEYTRKGLLKLYVQRGLRLAAMVVVVLGVVKARQRKLGLFGVLSEAMNMARGIGGRFISALRVTSL
ncbi:uncharacterized protein K452DRAFT_264535 [Aplosporella prunicola CBS 121167]|uniref:L-ornithine N(5)-oxygenase n=1 Tax=Aplosporella prunicola CBS 121167 TaxID=1176127 RepID=A0A6A6BP62_9PEZI|nr:uncharacterized protein K452DRAFT_264535 [Aplosporella prunicola CBS 121167]KAF2145478.1 hypothetical protein K452DRAFT_264535 [Aplosporella prunicola CBS 121167]